MICSNCGEEVNGLFCGSCGASNEGTQPANASGGPAKKSNVSTILVSILFGLVIVVSGAFAGIQSASVKAHTLAAASAREDALSATAKAAVSRGIASASQTQLTTDQAYKTNCLYNYFCSVATYQLWINLVNTLEKKVEDANSTASMWNSQASEFESTASYEDRQRKSAEQLRNASFGGVGVGVVGLVVFLVIKRARNKRASL